MTIPRPQSAPTQDVFELVLARHVRTGSDPTTAANPLLVHVWWRAPRQGERLVQVYVDGEYYDMTEAPDQRECWVITELSCVRRIELLAVPVDEPSVLAGSWPDCLHTWRPQITAKIGAAIVRDHALPIDVWVRACLDGGECEAVAMWPADEHRAGFGVLFGEGAFGHDDATGPGLGEGGLGHGPLGSDATAFRWTARDVPAGDHTLTVTPTNAEGRLLGPSLAVAARTQGTPPAAETLEWTGSQLTWSSNSAGPAC